MPSTPVISMARSPTWGPPTSSGTRHSPGPLDGGGGYGGREGVEQFAADISENWEELEALADEFRDLGDRVLVLGRLKARGKGSGAPVDTPYVGVFDFRGGRVWRYRVYLDRAEGLRAAGVSE
jgi:ketosteroid isomerase-like protein